jgi:hypothetical protein
MVAAVVLHEGAQALFKKKEANSGIISIQHVCGVGDSIAAQLALAPF